MGEGEAKERREHVGEVLRAGEAESGRGEAKERREYVGEVLRAGEDESRRGEVDGRLVAIGEVRAGAGDGGSRELDEVFHGFARAFRRAQQEGDAPIKVSTTVVEVGDDGATTGMSWTATITAPGGRTTLSVPLVSVAAIRSDGRSAEVAQVGFSGRSSDLADAKTRRGGVGRDPFAAFRPTSVAPRAERSSAGDAP
ncbi:MAG TPA: hypothetical protein VIK91_11135 [Nannocystis sp.]